MEFHFTSKLEEYYQKFIELQDKLKKSEEQRFVMEMKFNEMTQFAKEEEQAHYRKLRAQYKRFLEEDKKRQDRNERIIRNLERIETRITMLSAKTERINILRRQYQNFLLRISNPKPERRLLDSNIARERSFIREEPLKEQAVLLRDDCSLSQKPNDALDLKKPLFQHPTVKKALEKDQSNDEKIEILDRYLQSISSQRCRDLLNQEKEVREKLALGTRPDVSWKVDAPSTNHATAIADDIMNSIYCRYYNKIDGVPKDGKLNFENAIQNGNKRVETENIIKECGLPLAKNENKNKGNLNPIAGVEKINSYNNLNNSSAVEHTVILTTNDSKQDNFKDNEEKTKQYDTSHNVKWPKENIKHNIEPILNNTNSEIETSDKAEFNENNIIDNAPNPELVDKNNTLTELLPKQVIIDSTLDQTPTTLEQAHLSENQTEQQIYIPDNDSQNYFDPNNQPVDYNQQNAYEYDAHSTQLMPDSNEQNVIEQGDYPNQYQNVLPGQDVSHDESEQLIISDPQASDKQFLQYQQDSQHMSYQQDPRDQVKYVQPSPQEINQLQLQDNQTTEYYENELAGQYHTEDQVYNDQNSFKQVQQYQENEPNQQTVFDHDQAQVQFDELPDQQQYDQNPQPISYNQVESAYNEQYDETGQPIQYDQFTKHMNYDPNAQMTGYDQYGQPILYNQHGQVVQVQYDENGQIIPQYDENGQVIALYDQNGQQYVGDQQQYEQEQPVVQYDRNGQPIYSEDFNFTNQSPEYHEGYYAEKGNAQFSEKGDKGYKENSVTEGQELQNQQDFQRQEKYYGELDEDQLRVIGTEDHVGGHSPVIEEQKMQNQQGLQSQEKHYAEPDNIQLREKDTEEYQEKNIVERKESTDVENKQHIEPEKSNENLTNQENTIKANVMDILDTDTENSKQNTSKISNDADFDFS